MAEKKPMIIDTLGTSPCGSLVFQLAKTSATNAPVLRCVDLFHPKSKADIRTAYWGGQWTRKGLMGLIACIVRPGIWENPTAREKVFTPFFIDLIAQMDATPPKDWNGVTVKVSASEKEAIQRAEAAEKKAAETAKKLEAITRKMEELKREAARMSRPAPTAPTAPTAPAFNLDAVLSGWSDR